MILEQLSFVMKGFYLVLELSRTCFLIGKENNQIKNGLKKWEGVQPKYVVPKNKQGNKCKKATKLMAIHPNPDPNPQ